MSVFDEDVYRDQLYTEQQSRLLTNIPRISAPLSVIGSSTIVYIILKDRKRKLKRVYHRLLLAYSSIDAICSFNLALSALVVPQGTPGVWGSHGTSATCEASGFITQYSLSLGVYASFICVYYVLVLRYGIREKTLAKRVEPFVHAFSLITPAVLGAIMIHQDNYNPTNVMMGWCFINVYPMDCLRREEIECQRGAGYQFWLILNNAPFFFFMAVVLVSCWLTYTKVRSSEKRGARWSFHHQNTANHLAAQQSRASVRRVRETATQAFLYIAAFFLTYIFFGIGTLFGPSTTTKENRSFYFPVVVLTKIFLPLQGFWNCFIYIRPRYKALQLRNPNWSMWTVLRAILDSKEDSRRPLTTAQQQETSDNSPVLWGISAFARWITTNSNTNNNLWGSSEMNNNLGVAASTDEGGDDQRGGLNISDIHVSSVKSAHDYQDNADDDDFVPEFHQESSELIACEEEEVLEKECVEGTNTGNAEGDS